MTKMFRIVIEKFDTENPQAINREIVKEQEIKEVKQIIDLGLRHSAQIQVLEKLQECLLQEQSMYLRESVKTCPNCGGKLRRDGYSSSHFHAIFSDHKLKSLRLRCIKCKWRSNPSVKSLLGTNIHPDLAKVQVELGAKHSFREAQRNLDQKNCKDRKVNNYVAIKRVVAAVGKEIEAVSAIPTKVLPAEHLILQVDGGHVKSTSENHRSFEVLTSIAYKPENVSYDKGKNRGVILNKGCAASALDDKQKSIKKNTLNMVLKQGLSKETHLTALCDGAANCWSVVDSLKNRAKTVTSILDWFHIAMKFQNIALPKAQKTILMKIKWHLWRGNVQKAIEKFNTLIATISVDYKWKVEKLRAYIFNNKEHVVNYLHRKKIGLVFCSSVIESNVESIINQRCKSKKHMSWTREGIHCIVQIRSALHTDLWKNGWENIILKSLKTTNL